MKLSLSLFVGALIAGVTASNVVELTPDNFDSVIGQGKPALVEFFAPWCGHCKNLAPVYEQLADTFEHAKDKVVIAKVDADGVGKPLGAKYGVSGFPTLKWFDKDGNPTEYEKGRDLETLAAFVTEKSGVKSKLPTPAPSDVTIVDVNNWDTIIKNPSKNILIAFTAPWCGHCKNLKPIWEKVATTFKPESNCIVANINADDKKNHDISKKYGVSGYPTIKFFSADDKSGEDYEGGRSELDLVAFLNKRCGTKRAAGGGLNSKAGRLAEFDALAQKFLEASADVRQSLYKEAQSLASTAGESAKHYLRVMDKLVSGAEDYIEKESKRLQSILKKRNASLEKLDAVKIKANILNVFLPKKPEEKTKAADEKETVAREKAEL